MIADRVGRVVLATLIVGAVAFALFGGAPVGPVMLVVPLAIAVLAALLFRRTGMGADLRWAGPAPTRHVPGPAGIGLEPSLGWVAAPRPPATRRQVAGALGRAEVRQWLASPWFAAGVGFCVLLTVLYGWVLANDRDVGSAWRSWFVLFPIMAHPMVGMAVIGAHQAVTRGRRDGAEELYAACPADAATRTAAHLRCGWVPAAALAVFVVVVTAVHSVRNDPMYGPIDARALADVCTAVLLGGCGVWLGVALGRWAPWRLAPMAAVAALVPVTIGLGNLGEPHWSNLRQLSTWPRYPNHDLLFTDPPVWWHLLWLAALGALMAVVAFAHAGMNRRVLLIGLAVVAVAVGAGVAQTLPLSDSATARLASLVAEPERHQTCRGAVRIELCVYNGYEAYLDQALPHAAAVAAAAPDSVAPMTFRQVFDGDLDVLGPEVTRLLARRPTTAASYLPLGYKTGDATMTALRLRTAFAAVGLPARARAGGVPEVIAGQARGVVALWFAARGLDPHDARRLASHHYNPDDDTTDRTPTALDLGMAWPDPCSADSPPVAWSAQDLSAARALLALPEDEVHDLLVAGWERFTHPTTTTDELLAAAGLTPVGPHDRVVPVPVTCSY